MHAPWCNRRPETGFRLLGIRFPLCARCTGAVLGCAGGIALGVSTGRDIKADVAAAVVLGLPALLDGIRSYSSCGTTNGWRLATGLLGGLGMSLLVEASAKWFSVLTQIGVSNMIVRFLLIFALLVLVYEFVLRKFASKPARQIT